jgi:hypothetical protein
VRKSSRWLLVAVALVLTACGGESTADTADPEPTGHTAETESAAGPFVIEALPADWQPLTAREGGVEQDWGTDWGSDSPFIVLEHDGRRVKVEATAPQDGGEPDSGQFPGTGTMTDPWTVTGRTAGDDIVLEATARGVDASELDQLLEGAAADGRRSAPTVEDLPDGWAVSGGSDADIVMSIGRGAPPGGYVVGWVRGDPNVDGTPRVTAVNLAGDSADLSAWHGDLARPVNWFGDAHGEPTEVDGREAVFVLLDEGEGGPDHVLLSRMENGSLLVLTSSGDQLLSREQLVDLAASARPATRREWTDLERRAAGS